MYRGDILHLISFGSAGAKAQMRVFFDTAEGQAKGTPPGELKRIIKERFRAGYYKAPERAGVSCRLSPILRTYVNPDEDDSVARANVPRVMYYAPHVSREDIGGTTPKLPPPMYPFVIMPGPHGYNIQLLGLTERAAINKEYEAMLARLCQIKDVWCLPKEKG